DEVDVDERDAVLARAPRKDLLADLRLLGVVRRAVHHEQHPRARLRGRPARLGIPRVLADDESDRETLDVDDGRLHARLEIPLLVAAAVVRQHALAGLRADVAVRDRRAGVIDELALILGVAEIHREAGDLRAHALAGRLDAVAQPPVQ